MPSGKAKPFHLEARFMVQQSMLDMIRTNCSPSSRRIWITQSERLQVHTLKGVPGKYLDLLLPEYEAPANLCCEVGSKTDSYEGNRRWRITFRSWNTPHILVRSKWVPLVEGGSSFNEVEIPCGPPSIQFPGEGKLMLDEDSTHTHIIATYWGGQMWGQAFQRLRHEIQPGDRSPIFWRHYTDYFRFLDREEAEQTCAMWLALPHTQQATDIVLLNRTASHTLYELAVQSGWRKLTLRDKRRLLISDDAPQWQRVERIDCLRLKAGIGHICGVGQYTNEAARSHAMYESEQDGFIRTAYGPPVVVE